MQQLCVLAKIVPTPRVVHARMIYMRTYTAAWRTPTNDISPTYRPAEADSPASALPGDFFLEFLSYIQTWLRSRTGMGGKLAPNIHGPSGRPYINQPMVRGARARRCHMNAEKK